MKTLVIVNDPPYVTKRVYKALRLAHALLKKDSRAERTVFLMADPVLAARAGQKTPESDDNAEPMLKRGVAAKGQFLLCGARMDARGLPDEQMMQGASRSTMDAVADATLAADQVLAF